MNRRTLLSLALLPLAAVPALAQPPLTPLAPTAQDRADIARVEAYLGSLHSLRAHFLQVDASGRTSEGTAWIARPGRMRFQYDPPSPFLLVANYGEVIFQDKQLQQVSRLPLSSTPLGILLSNDIRLSGAVTVTAVTRQPGQLQISLIRTASPGDGSLTLIFADNPLALRQWSVVDAQQNETRVSLFNIERGGNVDRKLYQFFEPDPAYGKRG
jgi:outer membrane lipoprotein-sorting protein